MSLNLDLSGDQIQTFDTLPEGFYPVQVRDAEVRKTKAGTGEYVYVELEVTAGEHRGRVLFATFNISNPNPKASEIGRSQLKTMMKHANMNTNVLSDVTDLCGARVTAYVVVKKQEGYADTNQVKYYRPYSEQITPVGVTSTGDIPF